MIHYIVLGLAGVTALLVFCLLVSVRSMVQGVGVRTFLYVNSRLKERKDGILSHREIKAFLDRNGAKYVIGGLAEPVKYLGLCILTGMLGMLLGSMINGIAVAVLGILGVVMPAALIVLYNHLTNEKLLSDIRMTYQFIAIQTAAGVYISDALLECREAVENVRLRDALALLSDEIATGYDLPQALDIFAGSFDNPYIDTLCVIIRQSLESGRAMDLLTDVTEQLKEVEENILYKKQERLSRKVGFMQILFLTGACALFLYAYLYDAQNMLANF